MNSRTIKSALLMATLMLNACIAPDPPPMIGTAADPQVRGSSRTPRNLLERDETTLAIEKQLSATQADAESGQKMEHDMGNMPGMQHGEMKSPGMQPKSADSEKQKLAEEMKKTSDEMKDTSDALKQKEKQVKSGAAVYTCPMHPQIRSDKQGKCPICGMTLVLKKEETHEGH
ncbi:MAG TPA: heavy metal-binding domain-containing protein [Verrucomicrobiae bacterium]|jgi:rubrerythrin|nr:heavy metal-binding domain-containing protein [Verrucomicrobiae bacterium]